MMGAIDPHYRLVSAPIEIHWRGFRSDTVTLQRNGWKVTVKEDQYYRQLQMIMHLEGSDTYAISEPIPFHIMQHINEREMGIRPTLQSRVELTRDFTVQNMIPRTGFEGFVPVDCEPRYEQFNYREQSVADLFLFQRIEESKEIYLRDATIDEVLEFALNKQEPTQEEIRQRMLKESKFASRQVAQLRVIS
jgi:hypothetical protein